MSTASHFQSRLLPEPAAAWPPAAAGFAPPRRGGVLRRLLAVLLLWRERARQRRQLLTLNDHMLRDIGLHRGDAIIEGEKPFWRS